MRAIFFAALFGLPLFAVYWALGVNTTPMDWALSAIIYGFSFFILGPLFTKEKKPK